jgi:hypothetical protein
MTDNSDPPAAEDAPSTRIDEVLGDTEDAKELQSSPEEQTAERSTALDTAQANQLAARRRPTVLVLAGRVGCGKTSVYAAIYERLGRGPFGGWMFAGSQTIPGFEQRCHWWRTTSGGTELYMEHTRADDLPWLHLRLRDAEQRRAPRDLLFGDFDGELFDQLADGRVKASQLPFLRRADHVGLVIDGARIADVTSRRAECQSIEYLLNSLLNPGGLGPETLSLIVTKTDCLEQSEDLAQAEEALVELNRHADTQAGKRVPLLRLAVHAADPKFPLGHGLETLLELLSVRPLTQILSPPEAHEPISALGRFQA